MKRRILLALCVFSAAGALHADDLAWESDYAKALETAKEKHRPVLIDFSASWCGPCHMMETNTFANSGVQDDLAGYVLVRLDFDQNAALVGKYAVQAIPACFILNQFGERVAGRVGYAAPAEFRSWLATNDHDASAVVSKNQVVVDHVKGLGAALGLPDTQARDRAAASLMEIYCANNAEDDGNGAKLVEQELREFVRQHPAAALNYLNDRRLAVRILLTALLAERIGADFQFDPWDKSDTRTAAVAAWAKRLDAPR